MEIEEEVDNLMSNDIMSAVMSTKTITFTRAQSGWIFKEDKHVRYLLHRQLYNERVVLTLHILAGNGWSIQFGLLSRQRNGIRVTQTQRTPVGGRSPEKSSYY